jgi:hypothetical protein
MMAEENDYIVGQPTTIDIVCGREKNSFKNEGNQRYRAIIDEHTHRYNQILDEDEKTKPGNKRSFVAGVIQQITANGSRFVKYDRLALKWFKLDKRSVREKVGHALRDNYLSETEASTKSLKRMWALRNESRQNDPSNVLSLASEEAASESNLSDKNASIRNQARPPQYDFILMPPRIHDLNITSSAPSFLPPFMNSQRFDRQQNNRAGFARGQQIDDVNIPPQKLSPSTAFKKSLRHFPTPSLRLSSLTAEDDDIAQFKRDSPPDKSGDDPLDAFDRLYEDGLIQIDRNEDHAERRTTSKSDDEDDIEPIDAFPSLGPRHRD